MAFRALLFSKSPETHAVLTAACKNAGIHAEVCSDIFTAIENGKTKAFSCVIVDWAEQPEASFLLKRARESTPNRNTVAIAIVDHDPTPAEVRDQRLDYLLYRPISAEESVAVLQEACEHMQPSSADDAATAGEDSGGGGGAPAASFGAGQTQHGQPVHPVASQGAGAESYPANYGSVESYEEEPGQRSHAKGFRGVCAVVLLLAAAFCVWRSREIVGYLSRTPEGGFRVLRESVAALFQTNQPVALPAASPASDTQPEYFTRDRDSFNTQIPALGVVATESTLVETQVPLRKAADFPLPEPMVEHREAAPVRRERVAIPESMRNSAPITPPTVVTVSPAQMMPVSIPQPQPPVQPFSEPVVVSEEAERALLIQSVNPVYPAEALGAKLHGPVVLQVRVGRDGRVEDVKIVRGYFILGRAAVGAVKQWRFQPYSINGHAAAVQTVITVNFSYPPG